MAGIGGAPAVLTGVLIGVLTAGIAYLCGCFNGAVIVSKYILHDDVRGHGSGNAGLSNFHRAFGGKLTAVVLALDVLKMVAAVLVVLALVRLWSGEGWNGALALYAKLWAGLWCLLGHMFPCTFGFKGGKGILSGVTLTFLIDWRVGAIALAIFVVLVAATRYISLGSVCATASFPFTTALLVSRDWLVLVTAALLAGLIIWMHRGNLRRLAAGTESRFSLHRKTDQKT